MAGSEMETAGVTGKSKETAGSEAEMMAGMESGADTAAGMDLESRVDQSGAVVRAEASTRCVIVTTGGDAGVDLQSTVVGTVTGDAAAVVTVVRVGLIAETTPSACAVVSECAGVASAWLGIGGMETE